MKRKLNNPTNVRMDDLLRRKLEVNAQRFGVSCADLIREAVRQMLTEWEAKGEVTIKSAE